MSDRTVQPQDEEATMWLVRHGESTWNASDRVQGQTDTPRLTSRGRRQARQVAERLRNCPINAVFASDLRRARETAVVIARTLSLHIRTDPDLRERSFGIYEGGPVDALHPGVTGIRGTCIEDPGVRPPGGESLDDVYRRVGTFLTRIRAERPTGGVVVVAHGGSVRMMLARLAGQPLVNSSWDDVENASVWPVAWAGSHPTVECSGLPSKGGGP